MRIDGWIVASGLSVAGCTAVAPAVTVNDGYTHVDGGGTVECGGRPIALDGSHRDVVLQGNCRKVRITGSHVDAVAYVEPGAVIEVTGSHVDVVYRLMRRGAAPQWINRGERNDLIRNSRLGFYQDHDWWQEKH